MTGPSFREQLGTLAALLRARSLETGSFTLSSGKTSSHYIDARRTTMSADGMGLVGRLGLAAIRMMGWEADLVGGLTLGSDPVSYAIAVASLESPPTLDAFTVRKEAKGHGRRQRIEGCFRRGARTVITEDVITTGGSALAAIDAVTEAGGIVAGVLAVVDRDEGGRERIADRGYPVHVLVSLADLGVRSDGPR